MAHLGALIINTNSSLTKKGHMISLADSDAKVKIVNVFSSHFKKTTALFDWKASLKR
jgi:hypothetical protein